MRFGRNVPRHYTKKPTDQELMTPNPRVISERLLARQPGTFEPATTLNLLAAAWIQFQVHDWAQHFYTTSKPHIVPLPSGDKWPDPKMKIYRTNPDTPLSYTDKQCPAYQNENTHWWDASQIYGSSEEETTKLRSKCERNRGKLTMQKVSDF